MTAFVRLALASFLLAVTYIGPVQGLVQYCHSDPSVPIHFCLAIETWQNTTSSSTDLLMTFGSQKVFQDGWIAVGLGSSMFGALIFAEYVAKEVPILSVRHGKGHFQPQPSDHSPEVKISSLSVNGSYWLEASLHCYSYDRWVTLDDKESGWQPFIWAANTQAPVYSASMDAQLAVHEYYGQFGLDMNRALRQLEPLSPPLIDFSRENRDSTRDSGRIVAAPRSIFRWHGYILAIASMLLFPAGVICIRSGFEHAFQLHVLFQVSASALGMIGVALGAIGISASRWLDIKKYVHEPHVQFGVVLIVFIAIQNLLGWFHHKRFTQGRETPLSTQIHLWLGRVIPLGCCVNGIMGLELANSYKLNMILFGTIALINVGVTGAIAYISYKEKHMAITQKDEATVPFLSEEE
ncbi:eukaryotic cytochrome b561 domain-containing protein [Penicillium frequentans]|uniref:Eukaryotic cytochrome b561 domain-containing protein n=1 Tax=Penicillium frequentans TaxID=3151616 RepID=A0AAD6CX90_9EURO|nr:eukaryotic cytochrome b561 domain-containing protein [Penicillium glabrum]KAJ5552083.1 eukaryotic cytochrome b561 domain-containing protein [Penicillium glabrum]